MSDNPAFASASYPGVPSAAPSSTDDLFPPYKLYDTTSIGLATFFGSPIAGTALMALNFQRLGQTGKAKLTFAIGVAITVLVMSLGWLIPSYGTGTVAIVLVVATVNTARSLQGDAFYKHIVKGGPFASRWAASGIGIASAAAIVAVIAGIVLVQDSASKVSMGAKNDIYFSGSASRKDARALGNALQSAGFFRGHGASVVLSKDHSGTAIAFVVQEGAWDQPAIVAGFEEIAREVAPSVGGFPLKLRLADSNRQTMKEVNIGRLPIGTKDELFYYGAVEGDANALAQSLKSSGFLQDRGASIFLAKGTEGTSISFVVAQGTWDNAPTVAAFEEIVRKAAPAVGGLPIRLRLVNAQLEPGKELDVN